MNANPATILGALMVAMVLSGSPGLAQTAKPAQQAAPPSSEAPGAAVIGKEQAAPSTLPATEATTGAGTNKGKTPGTAEVGKEQAAPSSLPATGATTDAVTKEKAPPQ